MSKKVVTLEELKELGIKSTKEPYKEKIKSELLTTWAIPIVEKTFDYLSALPASKKKEGVELSSFPELIEPKTVTYTIQREGKKPRQVTRTLSKAQISMALIAMAIKQKELQGKIKLQMSDDKKAIRFYLA